MISLVKRRSIRKYLTRLAVLLKTDYGASEIFTAKQVAATIERHKLGSKHHLYAVALFSPASEFESYFEGSETNISYEAARQEIADTYFNGDSNFNIPKITSVGLHVGGSSEGGGSFGSSGFGGDGGHGGGGGDGG